MPRSGERTGDPCTGKGFTGRGGDAVASTRMRRVTTVRTGYPRTATHTRAEGDDERARRPRAPPPGAPARPPRVAPPGAPVHAAQPRQCRQGRPAVGVERRG